MVFILRPKGRFRKYLQILNDLQKFLLRGNRITIEDCSSRVNFEKVLNARLLRFKGFAPLWLLIGGKIMLYGK
jgi:hypothetical protein